ncbi:transmembrane protein 254-like [Anneissia japonica]|uniref:transmembrane protein 254-like n=1 Tax=Anneissia japonica TaxID=1529436 RepID=UPI0014256C71|nr:transmembrane protein 254-like [Anneissia japonica]
MLTPNSLSIEIERRERMESRQYIRRPHPVLMAVILFLSILEAMLAFTPENVPYSSLGSFGPLFARLVYYHSAFLQNIFFLAVTLNAVTGFAAYRLARSRGIENPARFKWCLHCLLFGVFSLRYLIAFNRTSSTGSTEIV